MNSIFIGMSKLTLVDYEGYTSCTLFTSGCNFRCPFCHNSELIKCQQNYISFEEIKTYLLKRIKLIDAVVITGGEPTIHNSLKHYLKEIKTLGFKIKLDTNGSNPKMLKEIIDENLVDYIAMDIKSAISNYHQVIGNNTIDLNLIKESINLITSSNIAYEFRTTLVKEYHNKQVIKEMKELLKNAKKLYLQKFVLRETCLNQNLHEVNYEEALEYKNLLENEEIKINLRGH